MELPLDLRSAIDEELASLPSNRLAASTAELSKRYRGESPTSGGKFLQCTEDVAAYAAFRLPATFAAVYAALGQTEDRLPHWRPESMLDVGAGPGTATWSATSMWPEVKRITLLEREEGMIALGKRLASRTNRASLQGATWLRTDINGAWKASPHDLVIASYVLGELPPESWEPFVSKLWETTSGTLVIVEPGTPAGSRRIRLAREQLLRAGANSVAPCPHSRPCPVADSDWCHFAQRIARSRLHRHVKGGELSYEDEKFSFVCASRLSGAAVTGRVIRHPQVRPGHIHLELCTPEGLKHTVVTRKDRNLFRAARDLGWGSVMPLKEEQPD